MKINNSYRFGLLAAQIFSVTCLMSFGMAQAATIIISTTPPVVNNADIANNDGSVDVNSSNGNLGHIWSDRPHQGQTFTTGSNAGGYLLHAVTLRGMGSGAAASRTFNVLVGTMSGAVMTQIGTTETATMSSSFAAQTYFTFNFNTPLNLAANTVYGFLWGTNSSGFVTANNLSDSTYTGGTGISSGDNNVPNLNNVINRNVDRVFHLDMTANSIPEPSTFLLCVLGSLLLMRRRRSMMGAR